MVSMEYAPSKDSLLIISSALRPLIMVSVITNNWLVPLYQVHHSLFECGLHCPSTFQINIFMIGLGEMRDSKHVGDGSSLITFNVHACLSSFLSLITPGRRFTTCFKIPNWAWLLRISRVHAMVGIENWRSFTTYRFLIATISIGLSRRIFIWTNTSSRWIFF